MADFKKDFERYKNRLWNKVPKRLRPAVFTIIFLMIFATGIAGIFSVVNFASSGTAENMEQKQDVSAEEKLILGKQTTSLCNLSDLKEFGSWENANNFFQITSDPPVYGLPATIPGNVAFCPVYVPVYRELIASVVPRGSEKANIVIQFDNLYRLIIGDGDYVFIKLEKNIGYPTVPANWEEIPDIEKSFTRRKLGGDGTLPGHNIGVNIRPLVERDREVVLEIDIEHTPPASELGGAPRVARYQYSLGVFEDPSIIQGRYGIGILGSGDVSFQPLSFEVK